MIHYLPYLHYLHIFASASSLLLAALVVIRNRYAILNQICAGLFVCFAIWSFGQSFFNNPYSSLQTALFFQKIASVGWINFTVFFILFTLVFTERTRLIKWAVGPALLIQSLLMYRQWRFDLLTDYSRHAFGWLGQWKNDFWSNLFFTYYGGVIILGLVLMLIYKRRNILTYKKKQINIVVVSALIPLIFSTLGNVVLPKLGIVVPSIGDIFIQIWAIGIAYAMIRFNMLTLTPVAAAETIIATMADLLILINPEKKITSVNKAVLAITNYHEEVLINAPVGVLLPDETFTAVTLDQVALLLEPASCRTLIKTSSGKLIPIDLTCSIIAGNGFVCVAHDATMEQKTQEILQHSNEELEILVTKRNTELHTAIKEKDETIKQLKKASTELKESQERLSVMFEYAPDAYYINDLKGTFVDGNRQAEALTGYKRKELIGSNFLKIGLLPLSQITRAARLLSLNALGRPTGPDEFILKNKAGELIPVELSTYPVTINGKKVVLGIARNLNQRKKNEAEKKQLEEELFQSQKLESLGQLAGGMAHDLNNLLSAISGYSEMIVAMSGTNEKLKKYAGNITNTTVRASDLTKSLLAFARRGKYETALINVHAAIDETAEILEHTLGKGIVIKKQLNAPSSTILGDRSQIRNIIMNLAINARDAMPDGGSITFATAITVLAEQTVRSQSGFLHPGDYLIISTTDTGTGMDEKTRARAFEPFFTTKAKGHGTGLGLASVYGIVQNHNGSIDCISAVGKGTCMNIYLPLRTEESDIKSNGPKDDQPQPMPVLVPQKLTGRILIIDDEESMREVVGEIITAIGCTVIAMANPVEALIWFKAHHASIDAIVLDMIMPQMGGRECFAELKKIALHMPVILASGYSAGTDVEDCLKDGANVFLPKPFPAQKLIDELTKILANDK